MRNLSFENFRSPVAVLLFVGTTVLGLAVDLAVKVWAFKALDATTIWTWDGTRGESRVTVFSDTYKLVPGWLEFTCTGNQGAVFGLGQGQRVLFIAVSVLAIGFLSVLFARSGRQRGYQLILGMLLAGVLGNMWDRVNYWFVRDMIHALPRWPELFPWIFNIADSLLVCGVILMVVRGFVVGEHKGVVEGTGAAAPVEG